MNVVDLITFVFEVTTALATWGNVRALLRTKNVAGVSRTSYAFSYVAGLWAWYLIFLLHLWLSFAVGAVWATGGATWMYLAWRHK